MIGLLRGMRRQSVSGPSLPWCCMMERGPELDYLVNSHYNIKLNWKPVFNT